MRSSATCGTCTGARACDAEALDVDAIVDGALRGGYLGTKHTRRFLRAELRRPGVAFVGERREWAETGYASVVDAASARAAKLIGRGPLGLGDDLATALAETIADAASEVGVGERPEPGTVLAGLRGGARVETRLRSRCTTCTSSNRTVTSLRPRASSSRTAS